MSRIRTVLVVAATLLVALSGRAYAQGGGSGEIQGVIADPQNAVLPGVTVTLRNEDTGVTREVVTDANGIYRFPALAPGSYLLEAQLSGFKTVQVPHITITIGLALTRDLQMQIQSLNESITVTAEAPVVDTTKSDVANVVTPEQIRTLPINSRQYLSLALLMPGTSQDATRSYFATVNVGGSMTFNSTGNRVDGTINNWDEDGEPRQDLPEDAVQEFKVMNSGFPAEYGEATGGIVQVVTKSGTNSYRGDAFEYFRDKALDRLGVFETTKPDFRRNQFGGSLGGPIIQNRMHFFGAFEATKIREFYTVNTGLPQDYGSLEGTFEKPSHNYLGVGRFDWQISNTQSLFVRYAQQDQLATCGGCGGTTATSAGFDQATPRKSIVIGHTWIRGTNQLNDFRFQYAKGGYYIAPGGTPIWHAVGQFPQARIDRLSRSYNFPSLSYGSSFDEIGPESRWEVRDSYSITTEHHDIKVGGDYNYMPYLEENTGDILGTYTFASDQYFNPNDPSSIANLQDATTFTASLPPIHTPRPTQYYAAYVEDSWKPQSNLTFNLGLRWERLKGCCNEDLNTSIFPVTIPYIDVSKRGDFDNFGPRTGFAWDVHGNGETVVRGSYGRYYGHTRILGALNEFRNFQRYTVYITNPSYPDPYGGRDPSEFVTSAPANLQVLANNYVQPDANQFNLGVAQQIGDDYSVSVDGVYNHVTHDRKIQDINPKDPVTGLRPNPTFGRVDQYQSTGVVKYRAVYVKLNKRFSHRNQFVISYTYTRSNDNNPLRRYIDPFNPGLDYGPSSGERRHSLVMSGAVLMPYDITVGAIWTLRSQLPWTATAGRDINGNGFSSDLVPGTTYNSGSRNLNLSAVNTWRAANGLGPIDASQIDSSRINIVDLRVSKDIPLGFGRVQLLAQVFNLFNTTNLQAQYGGGRVGNALSANFGRILTARPATQGELAVKYIW